MTTRLCPSLLVLAFGPMPAFVGEMHAAGLPSANLPRPVLRHSLDPAQAAEYERAVEPVMGLDEERMLEFLPRYTYACFCECPSCYGGAQGRGVFTWTFKQPDQITCRYCNTVYPNEEFPEDEVLTGHNGLDEEVHLPCYLNEKDGIRHFLSLHLISLRRNWLVGQTTALARAYRVTENPEYARRVALILDNVAQRYPHYPAMSNRLPRSFGFLRSQQPPYPWNAGRWGNFHNEIPRALVQAYDLVCDSPEFDRLSGERGWDVRERIENDLFRATFAAVAAKPSHIGNVVGYDVASAAILGQVIRDPEMVHWAFSWMVENVNVGFYADGMWKEGTPSYHSMTLGGLRQAFRVVEGYSDPPGYTHPKTGKRFDHLDPAKVVPFWARVQNAPELVAFPDTTPLPVHDTWAAARRDTRREQTQSTILPAFGHAALGQGTGPHQMQAHLHFSGAYGHAHLDNLNLGLWAKGRELLSDIGYTWTWIRHWTTCSLGHNLVVVDRQNQNYRNSDGNLVCFYPDLAGVAVVEAEGTAAYREIADLDRYQRLLALVPVSGKDAYVLDLFRVRGGSIHDWTIQGDAGEDTRATASLPLDLRRDNLLEADDEWREPDGSARPFNPYGMVRDVAGTTTSGGFHVDFRYVDAPETGLRVHLPAGDDPTEVFLGRSPSVRRAGVGSRGDGRKVYDFWMPKLVLRRTAAAPAANVFAAVHEPVEGVPFISGVERLKITPADDATVALRVTHGTTTDIVISTLDSPPFPERSVEEEGVRMRGRLGIIRLQAGVVTDAWLFQGEELARGAWTLRTSAGQYTGEVREVRRQADGAEHDAFVTDAELPNGSALQGVWMIVTHGSGQAARGFCIDRVERSNGQTLILLADDPALRIEGSTTREVYHPRRSFQGANTFVIPGAAAFAIGE